jgi:hypothetical protein
MKDVSDYDSQAVLDRALQLYWRAVRVSACADRDTVRGEALRQSAHGEAILIGLILGFSVEQVLADEIAIE